MAKMLKLLRLALLAAFSLLLMAARMPNMQVVPWQQVEVPTQNILLDIAFSGTTPAHGWLVGDKATLLESHDGGLHWQVRELPSLEPEAYLASISFAGAEGWVAGQPKILLHTLNEGSDWASIRLNTQLPGEPILIQALGPGAAEMVTNVGAIYRTEDGGQTWHAQVEEPIGAIKNIARGPGGEYLAVSSRGSFYFLYTPESRAWKPYPRESSRRIQNMGFGPHGSAWKLNQGAEIAFTDDFTSGEWASPLRPGRALSFGYLNAAYQNDHDLWVVGGGATLIHSPDGGKTWEQAKKVSNIPANFYSIEFFGPDRGFILGQRGTLLRYVSSTNS